jgi:hypothetical protein
MNWNIGSLQCLLHRVMIPARVEPNVKAARPIPNAKQMSRYLLCTTLNTSNASPMHRVLTVLISLSAKHALAHCQTPFTKHTHLRRQLHRCRSIRHRHWAQHRGSQLRRKSPLAA